MLFRSPGPRRTQPCPGPTGLRRRCRTSCPGPLRGRAGGRLVLGQQTIDVVRGVAVVDEQPFADVVALGLLEQRPDVPAPPREDDVGPEVPVLPLGRRAPEVGAQRGVGAPGGQLTRF